MCASQVNSFEPQWLLFASIGLKAYCCKKTKYDYAFFEILCRSLNDSAFVVWCLLPSFNCSVMFFKALGLLVPYNIVPLFIIVYLGGS